MEQDPAQPATISEEGTPPDNRFVAFSGLYSAYEEALREAMKNDVRFTQLRGIFDRLPPENPESLRAQGMEDMPNFNDGSFTAKIESYVSTLMDHNTGGYHFAQVRLERKKDNPPEVSDFYDEQVTRFFNEAITEWDDDAKTKSAAPYILESSVRDLQMGIFGIGIPYMGDDVDWRFKAIPTREVLVPHGTKVTLENCQVMFIRSTMTVTELYKKSRKEGWKTEFVNRLLYEKTSEQRGTGVRETFAEWENRVRGNDVFLQSNFSLVLLVDCYVQEFKKEGQKDGISRYIISRSGQPAEILYENKRVYGSFRSFIIPFCDNPGPEGDWHGVKGFGDSIFEPCHFQNLLFSHASRAAMVNSMPMFNVGSEADRDKVSQMKWTNMGIINPGIQLEQVRVSADVNGVLAIYSASQRNVNTNSRTFPTGESLGQEAKTATQSTFDRQDQAKLSTLQIKSYRILGLDPLLSEMYYRLSRPNYPSVAPGGRAAKSFRDKCEKAGVPKDCYSKPIEVTSDRTGGTGNQALDLMIAKECLAVASPGRGQFNARRDIVKALKGSDRVEEFVQPEEIPQPQQGIVDIENSCLADGQGINVQPFQDHLVHLGQLSMEGKGHLGLLLATYQVASGMAKEGAVDQNLGDATKLSRTLEAILVHTAGHVEFLAKMGIEQYQEIATEFRKTLNDVGQFLQTFNEQIGAAMEQQQAAQPQMSAKDQAILISAQVKAKVEEALAMQRLQHKEQDQNMKLGNLAERSALKNEVTMAEKQQQMVHKELEFNQDLGNQALQSLMDAQIKAAEAARTRAQANVESTE